MAVGAGRKLRDCAKSRIGRLQIRERGKAALAYGLIAVYLGQIRLVHGSRAHVLRAHTRCTSKLMLYSETPLHKIRCVELARRDRCDCNGREASSGARLR